jgi:putative membrane protein insertion efficiency factor
VRSLLTVIIRFYKRFLSPALPASCRFYPTCSTYALEAIEHHGALRGTWLGAVRLCKCHPFHPGGLDPVPLLGTQLGSQTGVAE